MKICIRLDAKNKHAVKLMPSSPAGIIYVNSGKNQARGIEASLGWHPDPWRVDLSGSYAQSSDLQADEDFDLFPPTMLSAGIGAPTSM